MYDFWRDRVICQLNYEDMGYNFTDNCNFNFEEAVLLKHVHDEIEHEPEVDASGNAEGLETEQGGKIFSHTL